jgi:hypothetical protein
MLGRMQRLCGHKLCGVTVPLVKVLKCLPFWCLQATHEWQDGVLARIMRGACKDESPDQKWILFDGPVDTLWIESMNTTLDDNKLLTLLSGMCCCGAPCSRRCSAQLHQQQHVQAVKTFNDGRI